MSKTAPHFIGIGAARSGTTWLAAQLSSHPDVWLPRRKELHYFTRSSEYESPGFLRDATWSNRLFGRDLDFKRYRKNLVRAFGYNLLHPDHRQLRWDLKYFLGTPSDSWYTSLFTAQANKITGEITPAYSLLSDTDVQQLLAFLPGIKIFYIMRDPVERAWSTIRYHEKRFGKKLTDLPLNDIKNYLSNSAIRDRSDYQLVLERWGKYLSDEQLFIAWYDEITQNPNDLRQRLFNFIGVDASKVPPIQDNRQVNASFEKDMPGEIHRFLTEQYQPLLNWLTARFPDGYPAKWLEQKC